MRVLTRSFLTPCSPLPPGWRQFLARPLNSQEPSTFYLSPEGRRFQSREAVRKFIADSLDNSMEGRPRRKSLKILSSWRSPQIIAFIKRKRKMMTANNPMKNLLKWSLIANLKERRESMRRMKLLGMNRRRKNVPRSDVAGAVSCKQLVPRREG